MTDAECQAIIYKEIFKELDGEQVQCTICTDSEELYHLTSLKGFNGIMQDKAISPSGYSKSVSLSASTDNTFGGNIKLTLDAKKLDGLKPMCYYDSNTPAEKAFYKAEEDRREKSGYNRSLNDIRAEIEMQPSAYKRECEWLSRKELGLPTSAIKQIEYFLTPRQEQTNPVRVDCTGHFPHHIELWSDTQYRTILSEIGRVREIAKRENIPFSVRSCFSYLTSSFGQYIPLDEENLHRLTLGEEPITSTQPPLDECHNICGCRRQP